LNLYEIAEEYQKVESWLDDPEMPAEAIHEALEEITANLETKIDAYCAVIKQAQANERMVIDERNRLNERKGVYVNRAKKMRNVLAFVMNSLNKPSIETAKYRAYMQNPPERAEVINESLVPDEYWKKTIDLAAIKRDLKANIGIPGTRLVRDEKRVAIR